MNRVKSVSKTIIVGIIIIGDIKEYISSFFCESEESYDFLIKKIKLENIKEVNELVNQSLDIIIVLGEEIEKIRSTILDLGYHKVFWNYKARLNKEYFIGINRSDFTNILNPKMTNLVNNVIKKIKIYER